LITSEILKDSSFKDSRITTYLLTIPKYLVYDITRHRVASYSIGSTRAIKTDKLLELMTFVPTFWGKNCPGMQAHESIEDVETAKTIWEETKELISIQCKKLQELGLHKQTLGRVCEATAMVKVVMTATDWINFFILRAEYEAEPELGFLATQMLEQYLSNSPKELNEGDWHIPFIKSEEENMPVKNQLIKSMARCARTSYHNFYGKDDFSADLKLHDMLKEHKHYSPAEHQAQAGNFEKNSNFSSNWNQYRKTFETYEPIDLNQRLKEMKELCEKRGFDVK